MTRPGPIPLRALQAAEPWPASPCGPAQWSDAAIAAALQRYVAEFGPLPGSGRYQDSVRGRPDYPSRSVLERRYGSLQKAGTAAGVGLDLHRRDWTAAELEALHTLVGVLPDLGAVARRLHRTYRAVQAKTHELGLTAQTAQGCYSARDVARWLHWDHSVIRRAIAAGVLPGAYKASGIWQIYAGVLLAAEGILYRSLDDLDPAVRQLVEQDARTLPAPLRTRVRAWQAYREPGRLYPWHQGEIRAWWQAQQAAMAPARPSLVVDPAGSSTPVGPPQRETTARAGHVPLLRRGGLGDGARRAAL